MGHHLTALVTQKQVLEVLVTELKSGIVINLRVPQFGIIPLTEDVLGEYFYDGFPEKIMLPDMLLQLIEKHSSTAPIAYIRTEFFGGIGEQGAIVWYEGKILFQDIQSGIGVINQGLRKLGVKTAESIDEFAALGLGAHRRTESWLWHQG